jgi:hypothetical protein
MTINVSPDPRLQFFGNDGKPLVGGKLYTYAAGTTTLLATYTDWYGTTPNTNPIILDSRGEASVWLGTARYKFVLKDANDVEVYTQDNLIMSPGADGAGAYGTWPIDISGNAATATTATSVTGGFVKSIIAGSGIAVDHATGDVTVSLSGGGGNVTSITSAVPGFSFTGTNAVTMNGPAPGAAGNHMVSNGTNWVSQATPTPGAQNFQWFFTSSTWTVPAGVSQIYVVVYGGGGGNAGGAPGSSGTIGKGSYNVTPGTTYTITIGAGGYGANPGSGAGSAGSTSSFGSLITCPGGQSGGGGFVGPATASTSNAQVVGPSSISTCIVATNIVFGNTQNTGATTAPPIVASFNSSPGAGGYAGPDGGSPAAGGTGGAVYLQWV